MKLKYENSYQIKYDTYVKQRSESATEYKIDFMLPRN